VAPYFSQSKISAGKPNQWQLSAMQCLEVLIGTMDTYMKKGDVNITQINNRALPSKFSNISNMINNAQIPSVMGGNYVFDDQANIIQDISVKVYKYDSSLPIFLPIKYVTNKVYNFNHLMFKY
jgi:hypothetical protein